MNSLSTNSEIEATLYCCMYTNCGNEYSSKYNLKRHIDSVHLKQKKFKCPICSVLFSSKQSLTEHHYKHQGSMPFKCITCNKDFRQASLLSLHKRIHKSMGTDLVVVQATRVKSKFAFEKIKFDVQVKKISLPGIRFSETMEGALPSFCSFLKDS